MLGSTTLPIPPKYYTFKGLNLDECKYWKYLVTIEDMDGVQKQEKCMFDGDILNIVPIAR